MSSSNRIDSRIEAFLEKVRRLEPGSDLEGLLNREIEEVRRLLYEEGLAERERATASKKAAFPPSGVSAMRPRKKPSRGRSRSRGSRVDRKDKV